MGRLLLVALISLVVVLPAVFASAANLVVDGGTLQVFTYPADIEVPPPAPNGLEAGYHHSLPTVDLTWQALADDETYNVYRGATAGGPYERIGGSKTESYADTDIIEGQTYYYVVTAAGANGMESQPSNEAQVVTQAETATPEPTPAPEPAPTPEPTPTPGLEPTPTPEPSPEPTATPEPTPSPVSTPTPAPEPTPEPEPTPTPTPGPTPSPEPTPEPTPTPAP